MLRDISLARSNELRLAFSDIGQGIAIAFLLAYVGVWLENYHDIANAEKKIDLIFANRTPAKKLRHEGEILEGIGPYGFRWEARLTQENGRLVTFPALKNPSCFNVKIQTYAIETQSIVKSWFFFSRLSVGKDLTYCAQPTRPYVRVLRINDTSSDLAYDPG